MKKELKTVPITSIFGQYTDDDGKGYFSPIKIDIDGKIITKPHKFRDTLKKALTLDLSIPRTNELIAEDIDGFVIFSITGDCILSLDEPIEDKQIHVSKGFSYTVTAKKVYISNSAQDSCLVTILFENIKEVD